MPKVKLLVPQISPGHIGEDGETSDFIPAGTVIDVSEADAKRLVSGGSAEKPGAGPNLQKMKLGALQELAAERAVATEDDDGTALTKAELVAALEAAEEPPGE